MRNNNNYNDNRIVTPTERLFYQRLPMEGTQRIIDECWKIIRNEREELKIMALQRKSLKVNLREKD